MLLVRPYAFALALIAANAIHAQQTRPAPATPAAARATSKPAVVSNSSMTMTGAAVGGTKTFSLPFFNNSKEAGDGDWYVTPTDAHAFFYLADVEQSKLGRLNLLINGKQSTFVIGYDKRKGERRHTDEIFSAQTGAAPKVVIFTLGPKDSITVNVTKMDSLTLEANFSGTLTGASATDQVKVEGTISLHRASAPAELSAGKYTDCDPIVHDWLNGEYFRAATECEMKFDQHAQSPMLGALQPAIAAFEAQQFRLKNASRNTPDGVPRLSEKDPYGMAVSFSMFLDTHTPEYQRLQTAAQTPGPGGLEQLTKAIRDFQTMTAIDTTLVLNSAYLKVVNFHGSFETTPLAGGGTVLYLPDAQPGTGGSEGEQVTYVLLGPWGQPSVAKLDGNSTEISVKAALNASAPRLSAQTVLATFHTSRELTQKAIQTIDWQSIRALIAEH